MRAAHLRDQSAHTYKISRLILEGETQQTAPSHGGFHDSYDRCRCQPTHARQRTTKIWSVAPNCIGVLVGHYIAYSLGDKTRPIKMEKAYNMLFCSAGFSVRHQLRVFVSQRLSRTPIDQSTRPCLFSKFSTDRKKTGGGGGGG